MAKNTPKAAVVSSKDRSGTSLFRIMESKLKMEGIFEKGLHLKYLPNVLFISALGIFYIGSIHSGERTVRQTDRIKAEVEDLRADYTTLKYDYMYASKQSEVAKKVALHGLQESSVPPIKIIVEEGEY